VNRTLFACGFRKSIELKNGKLYDITETLEKSVELNSASINCEHCDKSFKGQQYLDIHLQFKHPSLSKHSHENSANRQSFESSNGSTIVFDANTGNTETMDGSLQIGNVQNQSQSHKNNRKGTSTRRSYTVEFKKKTLDLLDSMKTSRHKYQTVAKQQGVNRSLVVKWEKSRNKIIAQLTLNKKKQNTGGGRPIRKRRKIYENRSQYAERYPEASKLLLVEFKLRRAAGNKVSKLWFKKKMKEKIAACYGPEEAAKFKGSNNWFQRFKKRHRIVLRRRTNKKKLCADDGRETIQKFHRDLRRSLRTSRRRNKSSTIDPKYGRWMPRHRYNVDQVPLPFVNEQDKTYETLGATQVWVSQPSAGLDKRQATLQLCIRATGVQNVKPALVFRGKGNVSNEEKEKYDKRVDVYFQKNAWMDEEINMQWTNNTLIPGIGDDKEEKVLFADNVCFQQVKKFHETCRDEINTTVYMLPENHTDKIQPVDAGCGQMMKVKIGEALERWLEEKDNLEKWHDRLSAKERRILLTQWTGEAWSHCCTDHHFFKRLFEKTGCLMTADGSDDANISPQGLKDYTF